MSDYLCPNCGPIAELIHADDETYCYKCGATEAEMTPLLDAYEQLQPRIAKLEVSLHKAAESIVNLVVEKERLEAQVKDCAEDYARLLSSKTALKAENARLAASLKGTQQELAKASDQIMNLIHANNDLVLERDRWKARTEKLANFNPDWDMLEATQESLREHMQLLRDQMAENAQQRERIGELVDGIVHYFTESAESKLDRDALMELAMQHLQPTPQPGGESE